MVIIELTDEEYYLLKTIFDRIEIKRKRKPVKKKWIRHDGCMINLETGSMLDTASNKFIIDQMPDLRALADQMSTPQFPAFSEPTRALLERSQ